MPEINKIMLHYFLNSKKCSFIMSTKINTNMIPNAVYEELNKTFQFTSNLLTSTRVITFWITKEYVIYKYKISGPWVRAWNLNDCLCLELSKNPCNKIHHLFNGIKRTNLYHVTSPIYILSIACLILTCYYSSTSLWLYTWMLVWFNRSAIYNALSSCG